VIFATDGRFFYSRGSKRLRAISVTLCVLTLEFLRNRLMGGTDNHPEAGKRPLSSITPVITEHTNGTVYTSIGGAGGSEIFTAVFQVLLNLDWGWGGDVGEAVEEGRVHDQLYPSRVNVDDVVPKALVEALVERGHNVTVRDINGVAAVVQGVVKAGEKIYGE
jgi:gamma-glutamyltranspeptidase / glutathione hydrolase / leukotriene-C4 hydrolase